jgi:amino acid permease
MIIGTLYYWGADGLMPEPLWNPKVQFTHLATVFGNTVFIFVYHHSVPGIIYPIRPQKNLHKMFLISNIVGALILFAEVQLAWMVFSGRPNTCSPESDPVIFPCAIQPLFNENFMALPVIG